MKSRINAGLFILTLLILAMNQEILATTIHVPADYSTIQAGIDAASNGDTVLVQPGMYVENINYNGKNIVVGSLYLTTQDTSYISSTIIDGDSIGSVVTIDGNSVVEGFTITNAGEDPDDGGVKCHGFYSSIIRNNIIKQNHRNGIDVSPSNSPSPQIINNIIYENEVMGIHIYGGAGAIDSTTIIKNNVIYQHTHDGIYCQGSGNIAPSIVNNTIVNNQRYGITLVTQSNPIITNNIIWGNQDDSFYFSGGINSPRIGYNDIEGGFPTQGIDVGGNINADPLLIDPANGDYHLTGNSPCIDAGDPNSPLDPDSTIADMGAYYFDQGAGGTSGYVDGYISSNETGYGEVFVGLFEPGNTTEWTPLMQQSLGYHSFPTGITYFFDDVDISTYGNDGWHIRAFVDESGPTNPTYDWPDEGEMMGENGPFSFDGSGNAYGIDIDMSFADFSYDFGASGGYVETDFTALDGGPEITIEMFVKFHTAPPASQHTLVSRENWGQIIYDGTYGLTFSLNGIGSVNYAVSNPADGVWHHLAAEYDGAQMSIYWDGLQQNYTPVSGNLPGPASLFKFGDSFDGLMDIVRISDIALYGGNSFDPWMQDYSPNTNTFLLYMCNEGSGWTLFDGSGHSNDGNILNAGEPTWSSDTPLGSGGGDFYLWFTIDGSNVNLQWDSFTNSDEYWVYRADHPGVTQSDLLLGTTYPPTTSYTDTPPNGQWYYKVYAIQTATVIGESNEVFVDMGGGGDQVTVTYPNGGETFTEGETIWITWNWTGGDPAVQIHLSTDSGTNYDWYIGETSAQSQQFEWVIPLTSSSPNCRIRVQDPGMTSTMDESDGDFTIGSAQGVDGYISSDVSTSGDLIIALFGPGANPDNWEDRYYDQNEGSFSFPIYDYYFMMEIAALLDGSGYHVLAFVDEDDDYWPDSDEPQGVSGDITVTGGYGDARTIWITPSAPLVMITYPNGGENLTAEDWITITWDWYGGGDPGMDIYFSTDGGTTYPEHVGSVNAQDGEMDWQLPMTSSSTCRVKIEKTDEPGVWDESDGDFNVQPGAGNGQVNFTIQSPENWSGNLYMGIWYNGDPGSGDPDVGIGPIWHDFNSGSYSDYIDDIVEGDDYAFDAFFDRDGSPNTGPDYCDEGDDMHAAVYDVDVWGTNDIGNVMLEICSEEEEYSYDFEMGSPVKVFEGASATDLDGKDNFSIEMFIMFHSNTGTDQILFERLEPAGTNNDMELRYDVSNQRFELNVGTEGVHYGALYASGIDPFDNGWHHIYIQYVSSSHQLQFFWDGALAGNMSPSASSPSVPYSDNPLRFGTDLAALVDEVRIRTASEDFGNMFPVPTDPYVPGDVDVNTIVLWHCNENGGTELIDDGYYQTNVGVIEGTGSWDMSVPWRKDMPVWWEPAFPQPGDDVTIYYDLVMSDVLPSDTDPVYIEWDINQAGSWNYDFMGDDDNDSIWTYLLSTIATDTQIEFRFFKDNPPAGPGAEDIWDDNDGMNYIIILGGGGGPTWINISNPNSSSNWSMGTGENIVWTSDSPVDYWVDIELHKDDNYVQSIHYGFQCPGSGGSYYWSIPTTLTPGGNYQVRVNDTNGWVEDFSDYFEISSGVPPDEGVIEGQISLNEDWVQSKTRMMLWFPGHTPDTDPPDMENDWTDDPPFSIYREYFRSTDITVGGPYQIKAYFDANDNHVPDTDEPKGGADSLYVPSSLILDNVDIVLETIAEEPVLSVNVNQLDFEVGVTEKEIVVGNSGTGTLYWDINIEYLSGEGWLSVDPAVGIATIQDEDSVVVTVVPTGAGEDAQLIVRGYTDASATNLIDTDTVAVHLNAWGQILIIDVEMLDFASGETEQSIAVGNDGVGTIYWDITVEYMSGEGWLSVYPVDGNSTVPDEDSVVVMVVPTGTDEDAQLIVRGYTDTSGTDLIDTDTVAVHLNAWGQILGINVEQLDFTLGETGQAVAVGNDGIGTLYWDINVEYLSGEGWLSVEPVDGDATGSDEDTVVVTVVPTGSEEDARILINGYMDSDMTDLFDTDTVAVHLNAWGQILNIVADTLHYYYNWAWEEFVTEYDIEVKNEGVGTLWWSTSLEYLSGDGWLSVEPTQGNSPGVDSWVNLSVYPTGSEESANIYISGYTDPERTILCGEDTITVTMDRWHSGTGQFLIDTEELFLAVEEGTVDTVMIFYHSIGNGSLLLTNIVSSEPEMFYYDTADVNLPQVMHPGMGRGVGLIVNPISGVGNFTGSLTFQLQNASSDNYIVDISVEVFPTGEVTTNTTMLDSVTAGSYDLTEELMISLNITDLSGGDGLSVFITLVDGTPPPVNASGDTSVAVAHRYWEIERFGAGDLTFDICLDLSEIGTEQLLNGINDFTRLKIFRRASFSDDSWFIIPTVELQYDEANNTICAMSQTELSQWTVGGDSSETNFMPAFPLIYNLPEEDMVVPENQDLNLSADVVCEAGVKEVQLNYLIGGDPTVNTQVCSKLGADKYGCTIDKQDVTNRGLIVWFTAQDSLELPNRWTSSDSVEIRVAFGNTQTYSTVAQQYQMISVPGDLSNRSIVSVLEDDLGTYDPKQWRIFRWDAVKEDYNEKQGSFDPGAAFWIITRETTSLSGGPGTSTQLRPSYAINLSQGWNQIANSYSFDNAVDVMQYAPGTIEPTLYGYDGTGYFTANTMMTGEGYWLWANESTSITFDLGLYDGLARKVMDEPGALLWEGTIAASISTAKDDRNTFGIAGTASEGLDKFDRHEPPVIGKYISLAFDNSCWEDHSGFYCRDIRPEDADGHVWPFVVRTNQEGYVDLTINWTETIPADWELYLIDVDFGVARDLKDVAEYRFTSTGSEIIRHLLMVAGQPSFAREVIEEYEMIPDSYTLYQNFPNPFNAVTTIRFALPEESKITLKIFDILGREIKTLVSGVICGPGTHFILWDGNDNFGKNVSTGVYFYWFAADKDRTTRFSEVKKIVLLK